MEGSFHPRIDRVNHVIQHIDPVLPLVIGVLILVRIRLPGHHLIQGLLEPPVPPDPSFPAGIRPDRQSLRVQTALCYPPGISFWFLSDENIISGQYKSRNEKRLQFRKPGLQSCFAIFLKSLKKQRHKKIKKTRKGRFCSLPVSAIPQISA